MASTYVNDLRLEEIATGEQSGSWGTTTNTNLELIAEAFSYGTEAIANASTHTITVADGTSDEARSFYLKCTGGGQACTVTLAPNTLSKVWIIENATSYTLTFSQGSGANVAISASQVKMIATDGAGSGAAVYDLLTDVDLAGTTTAATLTASGVITGSTVEATGDTSAGDNAAIGYTAAEGLILTGQGSTSDITLKNDADATVFTVPTGTDDILFPDNAKAMFGDGSDLQIYHDGSNSYIKDAGTGNLSILASQVNFVNAAGDETLMQATQNGAVTLLYDNAVKLATASGGVSITGEVAATSLDISGDVDVDGTLETDALSIASTTVTSTAAELNLVDGSSAGSIVNSKAVIYSSAGVVNATDMVVTGSGNRSLSVSSTNGIGSIEVGSASSNAAFIDLKTPSSDDFDVRLSSLAGGAGGSLSIVEGTFSFFTKDGEGSDPADTETMATFVTDGAVSLYFNNAVKLATTTNGVTVTGTVTETSDIRLKSNIETIDSALDKINQMRGVYFDKEGVRSLGVIAQEMQSIIPEAVVEDQTEDKYLSVAYSSLTGVLIEAIKELSDKVKELEAN
tara:strand:- start:11724 stop:13436 length:1713 start_codon:yes stop_codon:yes gene_type:complete